MTRPKDLTAFSEGYNCFPLDEFNNPYTGGDPQKESDWISGWRSAFEAAKLEFCSLDEDVINEDD